MKRRAPSRRPSAAPLFAHRFGTCVGEFVCIVDGHGVLRRLDFASNQSPAGASALEHGPVTWDAARGAPVEQQLNEYFAGRRRQFDLALSPEGTPFQKLVWAELQRIPYGVVVAYGELAGRLGGPRIVRAVGQANAANPIAIVIPCHRVIGADGSLVGYGGGLELKRALLELEGAWPPAPRGGRQASLF
jgi:methylated-DNA-[protein]-cysteine S-methyltransferase